MVSYHLVNVGTLFDVARVDFFPMVGLIIIFLMTS